MKMSLRESQALDFINARAMAYASEHELMPVTEYDADAQELSICLYDPHTPPLRPIPKWVGSMSAEPAGARPGQPVVGINILVMEPLLMELHYIDDDGRIWQEYSSDEAPEKS